MKDLSNKEVVETLDSMLGVYVDMTRIAILTDEFRNRCRQAVEQIKQLISQSERQVDEDVVSRYKVLFHDASPSIIEQLIRKLMREIQPKETQVDEEYLDEKAREAYNIAHNQEEYMYGLRKLIISIVQKIQKPRITKEEIRGWAEEIRSRVENEHNWGNVEDCLEEAFKEKGCEVEKNGL